MGAIAGVAIGDEEGLIAGIAIGFMMVMLISLRSRVTALESRLARLETEPAPAAAAAGAAEGPSPFSVPPPLPVEEPEAESVWEVPEEQAVFYEISEGAPPARPDAAQADAGSEAEDAAAPESDNRPPPSASKESVDQVIAGKIKAFITGGNPVVRIGIVVLFFGVGFLLKYATEHSMLPMEVRLAGSFLFGLVLLVVGWILREKRRTYALVLQGGGIGILYLTLFASAKLYSLVPMGMAFAIMVAIVVLSGILAVLQNALPLAQFGAAGGFLAPVLTSTGSGSHVALFSYYALLNAGILGIAWFRSWRSLNIIGFVFTFVIGSVWGAQYYRPFYFSSTEPFLILFFLFFVAISVLYAHRSPPRLKGYVDGTLVFGLPIVVFALQYTLVKRMEYGLAISALALGGFYICLAMVLWNRAVEGMRMLTEAFLALGVVFGSVAIPLALDGRWTSAAWSLEGAALIWIGVRQDRWLTRSFGFLLLLAGGVSFVLAGASRTGSLPVINGYCLGGLLIAAAGLFSAAYLERKQTTLRSWEKWFAPAALAWGLLWWFAIGIDEIDRYLSSPHDIAAVILFVSLSAAAMGILYRKLGWRQIRYPAMGLLPVLWIAAIAITDQAGMRHPFAGFGLISWSVAFLAHFFLVRRFEDDWPDLVVRYTHLAGFILLSGLITWELGWHVDGYVAGSDTWKLTVIGVFPCLIAGAMMKWGRRVLWPVSRFYVEYRIMGTGLIVAWLLVWALVSVFVKGDPDPLAYLPILNPLELGQLAVVVTMVAWLRMVQQDGTVTFGFFQDRRMMIIPAATLFLWLNAVTARCVHFYASVPFTVRALHHSTLFQASLSIIWGATALGVMVWSTRAGRREGWFAGAGLLGLEVLKLFFVDLSGTGTISRIVSFLAAGLLMLVIGFFSPLPPADNKEKTV